MPLWELVSWSNSQARVEVEIDGQNRVVFIRRFGPYAAQATVADANGERAVTMARHETEKAVPTSGTGRITLTFDSVRQRWVGLSGEVITEMVAP